MYTLQVFNAIDVFFEAISDETSDYEVFHRGHVEVRTLFFQGRVYNAHLHTYVVLVLLLLSLSLALLFFPRLYVRTACIPHPHHSFQGNSFKVVRAILQTLPAPALPGGRGRQHAALALHLAEQPCAPNGASWRSL